MSKTIRFLCLVAVVAMSFWVTSVAVAGGSSDELAPYLQQAQAIDNAATVTYVGDSWGPVPIWRVDLTQALNATIDVAAYTADGARASVVGDIQEDLWEAAGRPLAPVSPAPSSTPALVVPATVAATAPTASTTATTHPSDVTVSPSSTSGSTDPAAVPTVETSSPTLAPVLSSGGTVYAPIQIYVGAQAAKQPTVAATLTKALAEHVTLAPTVRLTVNGKTVALARIKALLAKKHTVKVTLRNSSKGLVVTGIAA